MTARISSPAHLRWLRTLPCVVTGAPVGVVVHHLQHAEPSEIGRKSGDCWAVPLPVLPDRFRPPLAPPKPPAKRERKPLPRAAEK